MADSKAAEALAALARDLVEEIAAGRALELAADETLELATFHVRGFPRMEKTRSGKVIPEEVRAHIRSRADLQHPVNTLGKSPAAAAEAEQDKLQAAAWDAQRARRVAALSQDIAKTSQHVATVGDNDHPGADLFVPHAFSAEGKHASEHLNDAQARLSEHVKDNGRPDPSALSDAYQSLHHAHQAGVDQVLSRAHTPEQKADVRATLDRIQGHMEKLDEIAGVKPQMTRRLLGGSGDQNRRARDFQDAALSEATRHAENGNVTGVQRHADSGLLHPDNAKNLSDQAQQVKTAQEQAALPQSAGPKPRTGAAAVYPQAAQHTMRLPGGTLSGHEFMHRAVPSGQLPAPSPEARALDRANARVQQYADKAAGQRQQDLKDHLAAMKAVESERSGLAAPGTYQPLTDEEYQLHAANVSRQVRNALLKGLATSDQHSPDGGWTWNPQRSLEHRQILADFMGRQTDVPSGRQALMLGGLAGSGKSTVLNQVPDVSPRDYAVVNPDYFKEELARRGLVPEVAGLSPLEASPLVHDESSFLADQAAALLRQQGKNIAYDVTMGDQGVTQARLDQLKKAGYQVHAVFVDTPVEKALQRAESRHKSGLESFRSGKDQAGLGSRHVPADLIRGQEVAPGVTRSLRTFEALKPQFASWQHWDNSGSTPKLAGRSAPASGSIPSVEELRRAYLGNTEGQARAAETGQLGKEQP